MGLLARACLTAGLLLLAACTSVSGPEPGSAPGTTDSQPKSVFAPGHQTARLSPFPQPYIKNPSSQVEELPPPLDLDGWPFGWVSDPEAARVGLSPRFWSERKPLWRQSLDPKTSPPVAVRRLEVLAAPPSPGQEAFLAAWHLWLAYKKAGLPTEARSWLDKADAAMPGQLTTLERAWDQAFRLGDYWGARGLLSTLQGPWSNPDDARKARLLRQKLFLGNQTLTAAGADGYVATLALDRDDLWIGTWNGAVVRWSLATGALDLLLDSSERVAPVKLIQTTGWFAYAFQEQAMLRYSKVTGTWRTFAYPQGWTGLRVQAVVADGQESLWVAYLGQGLWHWDRGEWTLVDDGGGGPFLNALAADGKGGFWVGTKDRGLWSWKAGVWTPVQAVGAAPDNISVIVPSPEGDSWAVGTWGEGTWVLSQGRLTPESKGQEYVVGAAWTPDGVLWGTLDEGLVTGQGPSRAVLGPLDGLPPGGVSALVSWQGRWIWGTTGQGLGWWSEHENSALFR